MENLLEEIQTNLFDRAAKHREDNIRSVETYDEFKTVLEKEGGFIMAHWDGTEETEEKVKQETKATIRCIPLDAQEEEGRCMVTGKPSKYKVVFAKAY